MTAKLAKEIMTLPIHPWISDEEVAYGCGEDRGFLHIQVAGENSSSKSPAIPPGLVSLTDSILGA